MKKKIIIISTSIILAIAIAFSTLFIIKAVKVNRLKLDLPNTLGVWWWTTESTDEYLQFAKDNGVDEIYYCDYNLNENSATFVSKAKALGFKVYALWGEKDWGEDRSGFDELMNKYKDYNANHPDNKLDGIHLDIEPHQIDDFNDSEINRKTYLLNYVKFVYTTHTLYNNIDIHYDIPFWFDDVITYKGITKKVHEHVIDNTDKVVVMSYRDTADKIYDISREELIYANATTTELSISVNMTSDEGDQVSFQEENKRILNAELNKLNDIIAEEYSVCIHHIKSWYNLDHGYSIFDLR